MALGIVESTIVLISLLATIYYYLVWNYDYWKIRGVSGPKPIIFFGTVKDIILGKKSNFEYTRNIYNRWNLEPFSGIFLARQPIVMLHDLDLIKDVLIKDFRKFADRGMRLHEKVEPLAAHLFNLDVKRWRPLRHKLTPLFTSGKLKDMFFLLAQCAEHLDKRLNKIMEEANNSEVVMEFREFTAKYTTDVIGVCAFGLQTNAIAVDDSPFRIMGRRVFEVTWRRLLQTRVRDTTPNIYDIVGHALVDHEMSNFFIDTMRQTMDYRKKNNVVRNDFIELLMNLKDSPDKLADIELSEKFLAAQLFVFFVAGFETSSTTMSNALYELAQNPKLQDKLKEEIKYEMNKSNGCINYDTIKSMKYLEMVFQETLRMYPPVTILTRKCIEPHTLVTSTDQKLTIHKGQMIWIPIYAIQRDPRYYSEPDIFDPDRFTDEAIKSRHSMAYLPFGDGPRNCIGKRFGVMQTKVGLIKILQNYTVSCCDETRIPYEVNPNAFLLAPKEGIYLKIIKDSANKDF